MKKWQVFLIEKAARQAKQRLEQSEGIEMVNLFNSGIIVDLKKLKIKAIETGLKLIENTRKQKGK